MATSTPWTMPTTIESMTKAAKRRQNPERGPEGPALARSSPSGTAGAGPGGAPPASVGSRCASDMPVPSPKWHRRAHSTPDGTALQARSAPQRLHAREILEEALGRRVPLHAADADAQAPGEPAGQRVARRRLEVIAA